MAAPMLFRVGLGLLAASLILFLAGFASNSWLRVDAVGFNFGLWAICFDGASCRTYTLGGHVYVGRVCGITELICTVAAIVLTALFMFKAAKQQWAKSAISLAFTAGVVGFLGAVVFIAREKASSELVAVSWSGILVIISAFMQIGAGVCLLLPLKQGKVEFEEAS